MIIQYSNTIIIIPHWVLIALALIVPSWIFSHWGKKKGALKFLMIWSFSNFGCLSAYMLFSRDPFAFFAIFHVLTFGLLSLIFYQWWKLSANVEKKKKKNAVRVKTLKFINIEWQ